MYWPAVNTASMHCLGVKWAASSVQVGSVTNWSACSSSLILISAASAALQPAPAPCLQSRADLVGRSEARPAGRCGCAGCELVAGLAQKWPIRRITISPLARRAPRCAATQHIAASGVELELSALQGMRASVAEDVEHRPRPHRPPAPRPVPGSARRRSAARSGAWSVAWSIPPPPFRAAAREPRARRPLHPARRTPTILRRGRRGGVGYTPAAMARGPCHQLSLLASGITSDFHADRERRARW